MIVSGNTEQGFPDRKEEIRLLKKMMSLILSALLMMFSLSAGLLADLII